MIKNKIKNYVTCGEAGSCEYADLCAYEYKTGGSECWKEEVENEKRFFPTKQSRLDFIVSFGSEKI